MQPETNQRKEIISAIGARRGSPRDRTVRQLVRNLGTFVPAKRLAVAVYKDETAYSRHIPMVLKGVVAAVEKKGLAVEIRKGGERGAPAYGIFSVRRKPRRA